MGTRLGYVCGLLDSSGEWQGVIGTTGSDMDKLKSVDIHSNGVVYVTGRTNSTSLIIGLDERSTSGYTDMCLQC